MVEGPGLEGLYKGRCPGGWWKFSAGWPPVPASLCLSRSRLGPAVPAMACVPKNRTLSHLSESSPELSFHCNVVYATGSDEVMELASALATYIGAEGPTDTSTGTLYIQLPTPCDVPGSCHGRGPESCARALQLPRIS